MMMHVLATKSTIKLPVLELHFVLKSIESVIVTYICMCPLHTAGAACGTVSLRIGERLCVLYGGDLLFYGGLQTTRNA